MYVSIPPVLGEKTSFLASLGYEGLKGKKVTEKLLFFFFLTKSYYKICNSCLKQSACKSCLNHLEKSLCLYDSEDVTTKWLLILARSSG